MHWLRFKSILLPSTGTALATLYSQLKPRLHMKIVITLENVSTRLENRMYPKINRVHNNHELFQNWVADSISRLFWVGGHEDWSAGLLSLSLVQLRFGLDFTGRINKPFNIHNSAVYILTFYQELSQISPTVLYWFCVTVQCSVHHLAPALARSWQPLLKLFTFRVYNIIVASWLNRS